MNPDRVPANLTTTGTGNGLGAGPGLRAVGLAALGQSDGNLPPIYYHLMQPDDSDKADWPDTSQQSLDRLRRKLEAAMTLKQAQFILSSQGRETVKTALRDKARETASYDTGWFTDGSDRLDELADKWRDESWPIYERVAIKKLDEANEPDSGGSGGSGGSSQQTQAGFSGSDLLLTGIGVAALTGGAYALYRTISEE